MSNEIQDEDLDRLEEQEPDDEIIEGQGEDESSYELKQEEEPEKDERAEEKGHKDNYEDKTALNQIRRDNFRYLHQIQELQRQLAMEREQAYKLQHLNDISVNTAAAHYEAAAKANLERARDMRAAAHDSGDAEAMADTDVALSRAVYEYEQARKIKTEHEINYQNEQSHQQELYEAQRNQPQYAQPSVPDYNYPIAEEWANKNTWFVRGSKDYDQQKHLLANQICDELDRWCYQTGNSHLIGSHDYFDELEKRMGHAVPQSTESRKQEPARSTHVNAGRSVVAPARGRINTNHAGRTSTKPPLSNAEKLMIQRLGVDENTYRVHKERSLKNDYMAERLAQEKSRR